MRNVTIAAGLTALVLAAAGLVSGCAASGAAPAGDGRLQVVAAENVWGSIASQLAGDRLRVSSVIRNPATDPHDYEPTAADARAVAQARMVVVNGVGYDPWMNKLIASNPDDRRVVLDVGDLVGVGSGGNPHRWYSPADVEKVIGEIVRDYRRLDPKSAGYFTHREARFERRGLARYRRLISTIRRKYRGVPVGASESIFTPLAEALGLSLRTPASFLRAISEGSEPTARDTATIDRQIERGEIKVWVFNSQNSTPDVQRLTDAARKRGIAVTTVTETPTPENSTFQGWQSRQLTALAAALEKATGR
jgi:zinc/manganese transport system substrate-binding protein